MGWVILANMPKCSRHTQKARERERARCVVKKCCARCLTQASLIRNGLKWNSLLLPFFFYARFAFKWNWNCAWIVHELCLMFLVQQTCARDGRVQQFRLQFNFFTHSPFFKSIRVWFWFFLLWVFISFVSIRLEVFHHRMTLKSVVMDATWNVCLNVMLENAILWTTAKKRECMNASLMRRTLSNFEKLT